MLIKRWIRLLAHVNRLLQVNKKQYPYPNHLRWWCVESLFFLADVFYLPDIITMLCRLGKWNTRPLTIHEIELARSVFHDAIDYSRVRVDNQAQIGCRHYRFAYVGFNVINSWGNIAEAHFIHEMVHVWQYQYLGSVYIPRALYAQHTREGYDYGGVRGLMHAAAHIQTPSHPLLTLNYEQQGDLVADYFRYLRGKPQKWANFNDSDLPLIEKFVQFRTG